jgi:hypothetical protein
LGFPAFFKHALKNGSNIIDIVPLNAKKLLAGLKILTVACQETL